MARFVSGFLVASLLWGGLVWAHASGIIMIPGLGVEEVVAATPPPAEEEAPAEKASKPRKKKRAAAAERRYTGTATSGDNLGGPGVRDLNAAENGGEEQLLQSEIEAGFDSVFPKVRRCLMLAASEDPVTGTLTFGMRIAGTGRVTKVNLKGPAAITRTEAGDCMRDAVRSIRYRTFNGPDMVAHYPLTLE